SPQSDTFRLSVNNPENGATGTYETDAVILGTGYHHVWPEWFTRLKNTVLATDNDGDMIVDETFCAARCDDGTGKIFIQNAETFHHGVGAPDLGLGAYRNATIINQLLGQIHYPVPINSSFQQFGL
ncbi:putative histamine N-monooxygenase, partial [Ochrobactrum sp. SFR4]|nr:putative histamine N-monooxygenase [Ochrobactrum sp. SFR4]